MKILAVESASLTASVAILSDDTILCEYTTNFKKTHSQTILPMIDSMMKMTEMRVEDLDAFAISSGPGSFTGLRIGAATVKGLAFAADRPVIPVPTLEAVAYGMYGSEYILCPVTDARRGETYSGLYDFDRAHFRIHEAHTALPIEEQILRAEALAEKLGKEVMYLGDGVPVFRERILELSRKNPFFAPAHLSCQRAGAVAVYGKVLFDQGKTVSAYEYDPVYLRKSQAEQEREAMGLSIEPDPVRASC